MLGNIIARLHDNAFVEEVVAGLDDLVLLARLRHAADAAEMSLGEAVSAAVGHFVQHAGDNQWLSLMTAASKAPDPAAACLRRMLLVALQRDATHSSPRQARSHEPPGWRLPEGGNSSSR